MALQANITLDLNKKNTTSPRVQLRQSDQNYPSITVQVTENGQPFNGTTWEAAFEGMTSSGKFIHDNSHFDKSTTPATGTYTYVPPLQVSSDVGAFELAYLVFEKAGSPKQRTSTANFRFNIIEQADINADVAKDYVSTWQSADAKMKALQKSMEDAAAAYKGTVDAYVKDFGTNVNNINRDIAAAETRITNMVNAANNNLQNVLTSNNTFTGENTFNKTVRINTSAYIRQLELSGTPNPFIDFHGMDTLDDYTTRFLDSGLGLIATTREGRHTDLSIHIANDANPVNVDTMVGGAPNLGRAGDIHTIVVSGGGTKNLTGTFPAGTKMPYSVLENIPGTSSATSYQRWTDFASNKTYIRSYSGNPAKWSAWKQLAYDDEVVHNTGNETIAGNKTFSGKTNLADASIHQIELEGVDFPLIDFHAKKSTTDYTTRLIDSGQGLRAIADGAPDASITMHIGTDATPVNIDTMTGGTPGLGGVAVTAKVAFRGTNPITGTLPVGITKYVVLEHIAISANNALQRLTDTNTGLTFNRVMSGGKWVAWNQLRLNEPTAIPANSDLNNYSTAGEYSVALDATAATIKNRVTTPSTQNGLAFNLTVTTNPDESIVHQRLATLQNWIFVRKYYGGLWTPWVATAGIMHTTVKGPFGSTIRLSRSANVVYAELVGMSGGGVAVGATTVEAIPADYRPVSFTAGVASRGVIHGYWQAQVLIMLPDGSLKNYGSGSYSGDGSGSWLVYNQ